MSPFNRLKPFRVVLAFEYLSYMRNKVYIGITVAMIVLIGIGLSMPAIISGVLELGLADPGKADQPGPEDTVHVIDESGLLADLDLLRQQWTQFLFVPAVHADLDRLKQTVHEGEARAVLVLENPVRATLIERRFQDSFPAELAEWLTERSRTRQLADLGLDDDTIRQALAETEMVQVETVAELGKATQQTYFYTYLLLFLLYMTVMMYGQLVASSVASEKSNRAMEMLITSTRPLNLMFGKVLGSGLAGLTQIGLFLLAAAGFYALNRVHWAEIAFIQSVFDMPPAIIGYTVLFYLLGYFMYAFLYGALGSLASRTEDINTSIMPVILVIMAAMFISIFGMLSPEAGWLAVFSYVPFVAPMAMFVRICMTDVPGWSIALSVALMLLTIYATGSLSSRIYRLGVLMYGKPPRLAELVRLMRQAGR
ncbi:MAG: ABC transporter permease [Clostridiaceae bacterium]|nr:ABC transporter permease [Clostridiaceae bacterium]